VSLADKPTETVRTETLSEGALFVSPDNVLYQVVMAGSAGFRKAEPWPWPPHSWTGSSERPGTVALVPGSLLARNYPVVAEGKPLPTLSRSDLLNLENQPDHYVFPSERLAKLAAQLDEALAVQSGLAAWKERQRWILSDGQRFFRAYHYHRNNLGEAVDLDGRCAEENIEPLPREQGPDYWHYIPGWRETPDAPEDTHILESAIEAMITKVAGVAPSATVPPATERATPAVSPVIEPAKEKSVEKPVEPTSPAPEKVIPTEQAKTKGRKKTTRPKTPRKEASKTSSRRKSNKSSGKRRKPMIIAVDIGYGYTKGVGPDGLRSSFPSVIGTAEEIRFATDLIHGEEEHAIRYGGQAFFYGGQALLQSRMQSTIFDRSRIHDRTYKMLFVAALVEMSKAVENERIQVVTGLPVEFFGDRAEVVKSFEGVYRIKTSSPLKFTVDSVFVAPQPFGSLFRELLNQQGKITDDAIEKGRVGIIDVGTYTTDFVVSDELRYVQRLSGSIRIGWNEVVSRVQQALGDLHRLELMPHEVDRALQAGEIRVRGEPAPLDKLVEPAVADIQTAIIARARDLWGAGAGLDTIMVSGGGGPHLYDAIHDVYPHARLLDDAFWANAEGFYRFGQRPATFEE